MHRPARVLWVSAWVGLIALFAAGSGQQLLHPASGDDDDGEPRGRLFVTEAVINQSMIAPGADATSMEFYVTCHTRK